MKPPPFAYAAAGTLDEAVALLDEAGEDAKLLAGGQSLLPLLAFRLARPSHLIDIGALQELDSLGEDDDCLRVGALVRHATLERTDLGGGWQALREAASLIGHLPVRVRGTFGGSLAHADPAGELGVVATAFDAEVVLKSVRGVRTVPARDFFAAPLTTTASPGEVLVEARFPTPGTGFRSVFEEFSPRAGDFAYASVAAGCRLAEDGSAHDVRIALGSVGPTPVRALHAEQALSGSALDDDAVIGCARLAADACDPGAGDWHADGAYRRALVAHLVERAFRRLRASVDIHERVAVQSGDPALVRFARGPLGPRPRSAPPGVGGSLAPVRSASGATGMSAPRGKLIGSPEPRRKNRELLTGGGTYVADIRREGQVYARVVRSPSAHARLLGVDASEALRVPGVVAAVTADDIDDIRIPIRLPFAESPEANAVLQAPLAADVVRYVGEPVAVVVADDPYVAEDAAELVTVDLEELEPVLDPVTATEPSRPLVHENSGSNAIGRLAYRYGDVDAAFAQADVVVRRRLRVHRLAAAPMETRGLVADYDPGSGVLTVWGGAKVKHFTQALLSRVLGLDLTDVRVVEVEVGGGFGTRGEPYPEDVLTALLARRLERPVQWIEDRWEHMVATNHAREQEHDFELAAGADGRLLGFRVRGWCDHGAYVRTQGLLPVVLPMVHLPGPYEWQAFSMDLDSVLTNRTPVGTYRGPGMTEATFARERMVDILAAELGMDPADLRRRNLIPAESMPFEFKPGPGSGAVMPIVYQGGDFVKAFDQMMQGAGYDRMRVEQQQARAGGQHAGVGIAAYIEFAAVGPFEEVEVIPGAGSVVVRAGVGSVGQGIETALAQIAAELLDVPLADVTVEFHDTAEVPQGFGAFASRSTVLAGNAIAAAVDAMRAKAAPLLGCGPDEVEFRNGTATAPGTRPVRLSDIGPTRGRFEKDGLTASFGGAVCSVSVNPADGRARVDRFSVAHDVGRAVNPRLLRGQLAGAAAQGIGGALFEEIAYDEHGQPLSVTLADYMMPTAAELPGVEVTIIEHGSGSNPLGIKGGGEAGMVGSLGAVANGVADAIGGGAEVLTSSVGPARLWRALQPDTAPDRGEA